MPIFLFAIAGAMIAGGFATLDLAKRESARDEARRRAEYEDEMLRGAIRREGLRDEARRHGLDPDQVLAGYDAMSTGQIDIDSVVNFLRQSI